MQPQGKRHYSVNLDRPCHITEVKGGILHKYLDETPSLWRDGTGRIVQPQPQQLGK